VSPRLKSALVLAGVFLLGVITGVFTVRLTAARRVHALLDAPPHLARARVFLIALDREVHLDGEQRDAIRKILDAQEPEVREIRRSVAPRLAALRGRATGEIQGVLRPDQKEGFRRFLDKQEALTRPGGEAPDLPRPGRPPP
jgi:uncharacterized membrane protein